MLENLNPNQKLAVETTDGPLLVLSGAGTGKTCVLTTRIAYILARGLAMPWQILALTFTNKAANEMKTRIAAFTNEKSAGLWCGTFHSICLRILRANAGAAGLRPDFLIYGPDEQKTVLKGVLTEMGLDIKDYNPSDWVERISTIKDRGLVNNIGDGNTITTKIINAYNAEMSRLGAVDFGDLIFMVLKLFDTSPDILERYKKQFKYILVDEFQDTNRAQMQLLEMLTRDIDMPNICCVGDDDQSIYSWRGAEIKNILEFEKTFPGATVIRLEINYRSTSNILGAANSLIRHNQGRLGKDLRAANEQNNGEPVYVLTVPSDRDEVRVIADAIERKPNDLPYNTHAVLIRAGALSRLFEEEFASRGLPYKLVGATKFYDRTEIRDAIAYLRLLVYPFDDLSFLRVIAKPRRGFGPAAIARLRSCGSNLMSGLKSAQLAPKLRAAANDFLNAFDFTWDLVSPKDAAQTLLDKSGYIKMWRESKDPDASDRLDNIRELITNVISKYDTLADFLEHAALMMTDDNDSDDAENNNDAVSIMTIHAAKGLEFDTVFLPAWEDGIFPNEKSTNDGSLEEERRLAYVAITRGRKRVIISNAMQRLIFGEIKYNSPSRFITEMDNKFLDFQGAAVNPYARSYTPSYDTQKTYKHVKTTETVKKSLVGKLVSHIEMGHGVVLEDGGDILTIAFGTRGIKKVAKEFIKFD